MSRKDHRISLGMLKGRPLMASVPTIAIRFNPNAEEDEELFMDDEQKIDKNNDLKETGNIEDSPKLSSHEDLHFFNTKQSIITFNRTSPIKINKRSTSIDNLDNSSSNSSTPLAASSSSDRWKIFNEFKGKITKTVEEKLHEIKSNSKHSEHSHSLKESSNILSDPVKEDNTSNFSDTAEDFSTISDDGGDTSKFAADIELSSSDSELDEENCELNKEKSKLTKRHRQFKKSKQEEIVLFEDSFDENELSLDQEITKSNDHTKRKKTKNYYKLLLPKNKNTKTFKFLRNRHHSTSDAEIQPSNEIEVGLEAFDELTSDIKEDNIDTKQNSLAMVNKTNSKMEWIQQLKHFKIFILFGLYYIINNLLPLTTYMKGFLFGAVMSCFTGFLYQKIFNNFTTKSKNFKSAQEQFLNEKLANSDEIDLSTIKEYKSSFKYEGWMNEYKGEYDPKTYHIGQTQSVFVQLEDDVLHISNSPSIRVPKRAMWNESALPNRLPFTSKRTFNMSNAKLMLLPIGIVKKRYWSKKYPICLEFNSLDVTSQQNDLKCENCGIDEVNEGNIENFQIDNNKIETTTTTTNKDKSCALNVAETSLDNKVQKIEDKQNRNSCTSGKLDTNIEANLNLNENIATVSDQYVDAIENTENQTSDQIQFQDVFGEEWMDVEQNFDDKSIIKIYLFPRTCRDKEEWFNRFYKSINFKIINHSKDCSKEQKNKNSICTKNKRSSPSFEKISDKSNFDIFEKCDKEYFCSNVKVAEYISIVNDYVKLMSKFDPAKLKPPTDNLEKIERSLVLETAWLNAFISRFLFDIVRQQSIVLMIQEKFQRKLSAIKLPSFIQGLVINHLDIGKTLPIIHRISKPIVNDQGLWIDFDITYDGSMKIILETKLNLMKYQTLQDDNVDFQKSDKEDQIMTESLSNLSINMRDDTISDFNEILTCENLCNNPIYNSSVEDSAESSTDNDSLQINDDQLNRASPSEKSTDRITTSKKILHFVDKIASSKYFKQATEYKLVKKALEGVSNTELKLEVEMRALIGTLVINIPPPRTHRLWIGFRTMPELWLNAKPVVGEHSINFNQISLWIEKKLKIEFQKLFVIPNMEDFVIPGLDPDLPA